MRLHIANADHATPTDAACPASSCSAAQQVRESGGAIAFLARKGLRVWCKSNLTRRADTVFCALDSVARVREFVYESWVSPHSQSVGHCVEQRLPVDIYITQSNARDLAQAIVVVFEDGFRQMPEEHLRLAA
jgi:hypothetical protein